MAVGPKAQPRISEAGDHQAARYQVEVAPPSLRAPTVTSHMTRVVYQWTLAVLFLGLLLAPALASYDQWTGKKYAMFSYSSY